MKAALILALILGHTVGVTQCTDGVQISVVRQEKWNGCGSDFIGADMRVIYRLANNSDHPIYVFGFSYDKRFIPTGYALTFNEETHELKYPTGNSKPIPWSDVSKSEKSVLKIKSGKFIDFDACDSSAAKGKGFARSVYISCDPKAEPFEFISDRFVVASLK